MAFLVLFSTVSFTVEKHYCGNRLVDIAVFTDVEKCGGMMEVEQSFVSPCCKDVVDLLEGQNELKISKFDDLEFEKQQFLAAYFYSYVNLFEGLPQLIIPHKDYSPPNLVKDFQVVDQVFLI